MVIVASDGDAESEPDAWHPVMASAMMPNIPTAGKVNRRMMAFQAEGANFGNALTQTHRGVWQLRERRTVN